VPDIQSEVVEDRNAGDVAFFDEICKEGMGFTLKSEDIAQLYRVGRRDRSKVRLLKVKCKDEEMKNRILSR